MAGIQGKAGHIIWQNQSQSIVVIDIPRSIEDAQQMGESAALSRIVSSPLLDKPYSMPEPTSLATRTKLLQQHPENEMHHAYVSLFDNARQQISRQPGVIWAFDRIAATEKIGDPCDCKPDRRRKRRWEEATLSNVISSTDPAKVFTLDHCLQDNEDQCADEKDAIDLSQWPVFTNNARHAVQLKLNKMADLTYLIPPRASVLCHEISANGGGSLLRTALRSIHGSSARFDLVLLDPPWQNASVSRSRRYSTMTPTSTIDLLAATDLEVLMADQCLVCVWVTNKAHAREAVTGEDGIFAHWGVQLIEEWVWFKMTTNGELAFPLDTIMRKPYEVLLVGRKHRTYPVPPTARPLARRALFAVPDVHSRKPCLKTLLEPLLRKPSDYLGLEVFARHCVSGWWSWGNECLLFNEKSHWSAN